MRATVMLAVLSFLFQPIYPETKSDPEKRVKQSLKLYVDAEGYADAIETGKARSPSTVRNTVLQKLAEAEAKLDGLSGEVEIRSVGQKLKGKEGDKTSIAALRLSIEKLRQRVDTLVDKPVATELSKKEGTQEGAPAQPAGSGGEPKEGTSAVPLAEQLVARTTEVQQSAKRINDTSHKAIAAYEEELKRVELALTETRLANSKLTDERQKLQQELAQVQTALTERDKQIVALTTEKERLAASLQKGEEPVKNALTLTEEIQRALGTLEADLQKKIAALEARQLAITQKAPTP